MAKISFNSILDVIKEAWNHDSRTGLPYSGKAVREAIQSKLKELDLKGGYVHVTQEVDEQGLYYVMIFKDAKSFKQWNEDKETYSSNVIQKIELPRYREKSAEYSIQLDFDRDFDTPIIVTDSDLNSSKIGVKYQSIVTDRRNVSENAGISGTLAIRRSIDGISWSNPVYITLTSRGSDKFIDYIDIRQYITQGTQMLQFQASYDVISASGNVVESVISNTRTFNSITYTSVGLMMVTDTTQAVDAKNTNNLSLQYKLKGGIQRTLHISIRNDEDGDVYTYEKVIDASSYTNYSDQNILEVTLYDEEGHYNLLSHGVKSIESWLTYSNGTDDNAYSTEHIFNQLMIEADPSDTKSYVLIQNLKQNVINYEAVTLFDYSVYSKQDTEVPLVITLSNSKGTDVYFETETSILSGIPQSLTTTVEIENSVDDEIKSYLSIKNKDTGEIYVNGRIVLVDNHQKFAPVEGAVFWLNPKTRNNSERNPFTIVNAVNGKTINTCEFEGFEALNDLWVSDEEGQKVLRVMAGQKLTIDVDWLKQFKARSNGTIPEGNVTMELLLKVKNVTEENEPIIKAAEYYTIDGQQKFRGLEMNPFVGRVLTSTKVTEQEQRFSIQEDEKTHIAINILSNMQPDPDDTEKTLSECRIFINSVYSRGFTFDKTKQEWYDKGSKIVIGQDHADIDIYGIRIYEKALSAENIAQNYKSTLATSRQKTDYNSRNDIKGENGFISLDKVKIKGQNCIVWHAEKRVYSQSKDSTTGWLELFIYDDKGNYLPEFSGTICKETKTLPCKGQGTTAKTYYYWNEQYGLKDVVAMILVEIKNLHEDVLNDMFGGEVTEEKIIEKDGKQYVEVVDGWIDGNGKYRGNRYKLYDNVNYANKLVKKINYASSMQSHLMGANNAYNDLYMRVVGQPEYQKRDGNTKARVTKPSRAFYEFSSYSADEEPSYQGLCTFGPGKMDEGTLGFNKKKHTNFTMIEGAGNNFVLTDFRTPWESKYVEEVIETDEEGNRELAGWSYNGTVSIDLDKFVKSKGTDGVARTNDVVLGKIKEFVNFLYKYDVGITVFDGQFSGSADSFLNSAESKKTDKKVWCTSGSEAYKLKRYHEILKTWVDAGWNEETETIVPLDLREEYSSVDVNAGRPENVNKKFIAAIAAKAATVIDSIIEVKSLQFHYCYINMYQAGTDNNSKNTYYVLDPYTLKFYLFQDDVDTIRPTDNSGLDTKPYYIDRQHPYEDGSSISLYEGGANSLFNLTEAIYEGNGSLRRMMHRIFDAMISIMKEDKTAMPQFSGDKDILPHYSKDNRDTVWGFEWKYFFSIQTYFPELAWNEQARLRYEYPESLGYRSQGRNVSPISQNMGNALESELFFMKRRIVYIASYCGWGDFGYVSDSKGITGIDDAKEVLSLQAYPTADGDNSYYVFKDIMVHQYMYPSGSIDASSRFSNMRCKPGEKYTFDLTQGTAITGDSATRLYGINFYRSLGNFGNISTKPTSSFGITAKRLTEFIAEPDGEAQFRPSSLTFNTPLLERLSLKGCSLIGGTLDLAGLSRVRSVDLRGCRRILNVHFPSSSFLTEAHVNDGIRNIVLKEQPNLGDLTFEGYSGVETVEIRNNSAFDSRKFIVDLYNAKSSVEGSAEVERIVFDRISWEGVSLNLLRWLMEVKDAQLQGRISLVKSDNYTLTFDDKVKLGRKYGDIDSEGNGLYVEYEVKDIASVQVKCDDYIRKTGLYEGASLSVMPKNGNSVRIDEDGNLLLRWKLDEGAYEYAEIVDTALGSINVKKLSDPADKLKFELSASLTTMGGEELTASARVGFYDRIPEVGDFAYGDGSFSDEYNPEKDWIGWVFKKDKADGGYLIRVVSVHSAKRDYMWYGLVLQGGTQWNSTLFRITQAQKEEIQDGIGMQVAPLAVYTPKSLGIKSCEDLIDESADDGFKSVADNVAAGVYVGKMWTDEAIKVAKGTFAYANEPFPNTLSELAGLLEKYKDDPQKQCMFYPIFTYAYLYEPKADSPLHPSYRKNKWYVPSWGEALLFMLFFFNSQGKGRELWKGVNEDINDLDSPKKDALRPYVSNLIRKIHEVKPGLSIPALICGDFCCAEYTTDGNGVVEIGDRFSFAEGHFYEKDIRGVQPCCQFFYESNS